MLGLLQEIDPGIIESSLDICQELSTTHGRQFNLSFDRMLIAQGSKGISDGDVNLLGNQETSFNFQISKMSEVQTQIGRGTGNSNYRRQHRITEIQN